MCAVVAALTVGSDARAQGAADDDVIELDENRALTEWLSQAQLVELLVTVLEQQVRRSTDADPNAVARLADAYLSLIGSAQDEERITDLRARVLKFVEREGSAHEVPLRLALSRADYRLALKAIDRMRGGELDRPVIEAASLSLARARDPLDQFAQLLANRIGEARARAAGADDVQRRLSMEEVDKTTQQLLEARFLKAWCAYWTLWISRQTTGPGRLSEEKRQAEGSAVIRLLAELLETGIPYPEPEHVSVDLSGEEYYANSILAMALAKSLVASMEVADPWFDLLDGDGIWPGVKEHGSWYLQALVDTGNYQRALAFIEQTPRPVSTSDAVGAACRGVVESRASEDAMKLAAGASAIAATEGDLVALRRLVRRVPALLQGNAFSASLARGVEAYEQGRALKSGDKATALFDSAIKDLSRARELAPENSKALSACSDLLGWALLGAGKYCDASEEFVQCAGMRTGVQAEEDLWMAVRAAQAGACLGEDATRGGRAMEIAGSYLTKYPQGIHCADAMATFAKSPEAFRDAALVRLLYANALKDGASAQQREAAALLIYRRFRAASGDARREEAMRLLAIGSVDATKWAPGTIDTVLRQQLEAALDGEVRRVDLGSALLGIVESRYAAGAEPSEFRAEMGVRRLALAVLQGRPIDAVNALEVVRATGDNKWRPIAQAMFVAGADAMIQSGKIDALGAQSLMLSLVEARRAQSVAARASGDPVSADRAVIELGESLLRAASSVRVARASSDWNERAGAMDREALAIAEEVLAHRPDDVLATELMADAAMGCGNTSKAIEALIRLVAGLAPASPAWFERKADLCEVLAASDPIEAKKVLEQHVVLFPEWGASDGAVRMKALAAKLGVRTPSGVTPAGAKR